jgi:hypothetical protein
LAGRHELGLDPFLIDPPSGPYVGLRGNAHAYSEIRQPRPACSWLSVVPLLHILFAAGTGLVWDSAPWNWFGASWAYDTVTRPTLVFMNADNDEQDGEANRYVVTYLVFILGCGVLLLTLIARLVCANGALAQAPSVAPASERPRRTHYRPIRKPSSRGRRSPRPTACHATGRGARAMAPLPQPSIPSLLIGLRARYRARRTASCSGRSPTDVDLCRRESTFQKTIAGRSSSLFDR